MSRPSALRAATAASAFVAGLLSVAGMSPVHATHFVVTKLVSNGAVPAPNTDPNLVNPWGLASSPSGPFWVADNGTGVSTIYNSSGTPIPLVVTIPPPSGSAPTGAVYNGSSSFQVTANGKSGSALFIFDTEGGTIAGWSPGVDLNNAVQARDFSTLGAGAEFKGLAIGSSGGSNYLYAADFGNGLVEQLDSNFNIVRSFTDPSVAPGYSPFGIQTIGNQLFVTYALKNGKDDVQGPGNGYVDIFNLDGTFVQRLVSAGGQINSPWALDLAPSSFGQFAGDLLVGNFGDGTISVFDPSNGNFLGQLLGNNGMPLIIDDLWALRNGNGGAGGDANSVYFTAGINDEADGLFGAISRAVPEPSTWAMMLLGFCAIGVSIRRKSGKLVQIA